MANHSSKQAADRRPPRALTFVAALILAGLMALLLVEHRAPTTGLVRITGPTMGTSYTVQLLALPPGKTVDDVRRVVEGRLESINATMSTYVSDSEVSRLSRHSAPTWFPISSETAKVIAEAQRVSHLTAGAFDITVAPLVRLWGFGGNKTPTALPNEADIAPHRSHVGVSKLELKLQPPSIRKLDAGTEVDLSGIAKGYAVDAVSDELKKLGAESFWVDIGGDLRVGAEKAPGAPWVAAIERPTEHERSAETRISLTQRAMATSGDYRNFFTRNGERFSHTIDPRTGKPVTHTLASVSVVAPNCMEADALATAFLVLGPEPGYRMAESLNVPAFFIERRESGFVSRATPAMKTLILAPTNPPRS